MLPMQTNITLTLSCGVLLPLIANPSQTVTATLEKPDVYIFYPTTSQRYHAISSPAHADSTVPFQKPRMNQHPYTDRYTKMLYFSIQFGHR